MLRYLSYSSVLQQPCSRSLHWSTSVLRIYTHTHTTHLLLGSQDHGGQAGQGGTRSKKICTTLSPTSPRLLLLSW